MKDDTSSTLFSEHVRDIIVSKVSHHYETRTVRVTVGQVLDEWKSDNRNGQIESMRSVYNAAIARGCSAEQAKKYINRLKEDLPCVMWSGLFRDRASPVSVKLEQHSGLLCADIDNLSSVAEAAKVREHLRNSPYCVAAFLSPSGVGVKALFRIPPSIGVHEVAFEAVSVHVRELTGCELDPSGKNIDRLCYATFDPDLWINWDAQELPLPEQNVMQNADESTLLHHSTYLHHNSARARIVLESMAELERTEEFFKSVFVDGCQGKSKTRAEGQGLRVAKLYKTLVEDRVVARTGERNDFLTHAVPFLYRALAPSLVRLFVGRFYDCHHMLFNDSRHEHMKQAEALINGVAETFLANLPEETRTIYEKLGNDHLRDVFRIIRDFAHRDRQRHFSVGFEHCGDRVGLEAMEVKRIYDRFYRIGFMDLVEPGCKRQKGIPGKANRYKWQLD